MDVDDAQELHINPNYNFYIVSTARPNAQLFAVRAEWEIEEIEEIAGEDDGSDNGSDHDCDEEDDGYHIAIIQFAGLPHLVIGLPRSTHDQVLDLAADLKLKVAPGHPMTSKKEHFPLNAAADSMFTLENLPGTVTKQTLRKLMKKERIQIGTYLAEREKENKNTEYSGDCGDDITVTLVP